MRSLRCADRGSVLLLQLFLVTTVLMAVAVISDVGSVIGARQQLAATADQAAIAGAQAVDLGAYYAGGADGVSGLALEPVLVEAAVRRHLAPAIQQQQQPGLALADLAVDADGVTVRLRCTAVLPFASLLGLSSVPVTASSRARLLVQPPL